MLALGALVVLVTHVGQTGAQEEPPPAERVRPDHVARDRRHFAKALAKVKENMPGKAIVEALGRPDDVRTQYDPGSISTFHTKEIWCYGTNGHLTFPTLGCVYVDTEDKVQYVFGGQGDPPASDLFREEQLRELLRLIDQAPPLAGYRYDPRRVIRIVNALQSLGKDKALAAIGEYLRVASPFDSEAREGLFVVLRVLFDVPKGPAHMPTMYVGAPFPGAPKDMKPMPRFPVLLLDDVPLLLVSGYVLVGEAEPVERHVAYFRKWGRLRSTPLIPVDAPFEVYEKFRRLYLGAYGDKLGEWGREQVQILVINQLLRLVDSVYRRDPEAFDYQFAPKQDLAGHWKKLKADFTRLRVRWDARGNRYTFRNGTALLDRPVKQYRRAIWKIDNIPGAGQVIFERRDEQHVRILFEWSGRAGTDLKGVTPKALAGTDGRKPLAGAFPASVEATVGDRCFSQQTQLVELREGGQVRVRVSLGNRTRTSPVYRP
jgi:hypothetical protein